jgi:hypothetical protein
MTRFLRTCALVLHDGRTVAVAPLLAPRGAGAHVAVRW